MNECATKNTTQRAASPECIEPDGASELTTDDVTLWDVENRPTTTLGRELKLRGVEFPPPADLADEELPEVLWTLIRCLAALHVFLSSTDHLSDRRLYELLWTFELTQETWMPLLDQPEAMHVDLASEDQETYLRYYADEETRAQWAVEFPQDALPPHAPAPFDRDRFLPQAEEMHLLFRQRVAGGG